MKKITIFLTAVVLLISASSFATNDPVSEKIKVAFAKNFAAASDVKWDKVDNNYFAQFTINQQNTSAAYDEDGNLLAVSRIIQLSEVPMNISIALQNQYPHYSFSDAVTEIGVNGETYYTIKGQSEKNIITIKANSSGNLSVDNKIKKSN